MHIKGMLYHLTSSKPFLFPCVMYTSDCFYGAGQRVLLLHILFDNKFLIRTLNWSIVLGNQSARTKPL